MAAEGAHVWPKRVVHFMKEALQQAAAAFDAGEVAVGCVIVRGDDIIGRGGNQTNVLQDGSRHCEFVAIEEVLQSYGQDVFRECELFVTVEPCIMCAYALSLIGIGKVYYGCANDRFGGNGSVLSLHTHAHIELPTHHTYASIGGILADEAVEMLKRLYERSNVRAPQPQRPVPTTNAPSTARSTATPKPVVATAKAPAHRP